MTLFACLLFVCFLVLCFYACCLMLLPPDPAAVDSCCSPDFCSPLLSHAFSCSCPCSCLFCCPSLLLTSVVLMISVLYWGLMPSSCHDAEASGSHGDERLWLWWRPDSVLQLHAVVDTVTGWGDAQVMWWRVAKLYRSWVWWSEQASNPDTWAPICWVRVLPSDCVSHGKIS